MKKRLSHFPYNERSRPGWTPSTSLRKPLSPIRSTMKTVTYVPGTFVTLVPGPYTSRPGGAVSRQRSRIVDAEKATDGLAISFNEADDAQAFVSRKFQKWKRDRNLLLEHGRHEKRANSHRHHLNLCPQQRAEVPHAGESFQLSNGVHQLPGARLAKDRLQQFQGFFLDFVSGQWILRP